MKLTVENLYNINLWPEDISVKEYCENAGISPDTTLADLNRHLTQQSYKFAVKDDDIMKLFASCEEAIISLADNSASYEAGTQHIDSISVIKDICDQYNAAVVSDVLANNVINKEQYENIQANPSEKNKIIDEKYLPKVKRWAFNKVNSEDYDYNVMPEPTLSKSINPTIINSLVETYMKEYEKSEKNVPFDKE